MKNLTKNTVSFLIGYIASGLSILAFFMAFSYETMGSSMASFVSGSAGAIGYIWAFIKVLFFPGLFLLCLILNNKKKQLNKFLSIFWIVISVVCIVTYIVKMSSYGGSGIMGALSGMLVPSSYKVANWLRVFGATGAIITGVISLLPKKQVDVE